MWRKGDRIGGRIEAGDVRKRIGERKGGVETQGSDKERE